jgi:hypothetical protein
MFSNKYRDIKDIGSYLGDKRNVFCFYVFFFSFTNCIAIIYNECTESFPTLMIQCKRLDVKSIRYQFSMSV